MATPRLAPVPDRLAFIDNLRSLAIILVVTMHAAVTYSNFGRWYFMEPTPAGLPTLLFFGMYQSFLQAWFMGFLFLLAGYFVPASFDRKGPKRFIADRAFRLGVPFLIYALFLHPLIVWTILPLFRTGHARPFGPLWLRYLARFQFVGESGPLWFAVALLIFSLVYAVLRVTPRTASREVESDGLPGNRAVVLLILAISICTFLVRTVQPIGTAILNMQLCFFSQYVILFMVGIRAGRGKWLTRIPYRFGVRWFIAAQAGGVLLWLGTVVAARAMSRGDLALLNGGWHWQSALSSFWESFYCVGTCLGLTVLFRDRFNWNGPVARFLSTNAFSVYVFHAPILIAVTIALHNFAAPPVARFLLASILAVAASFLLSEFLFRRIPLLKSALR